MCILFCANPLRAKQGHVLKAFIVLSQIARCFMLNLHPHQSIIIFHVHRGGRGRSSCPILSSIVVQYYRPRIEFRPVLGRGRDRAQFAGGKYYRPWTEISSALDGNIIGLDEDGTEPNSQKENIIGLGRKYYRPWTEILSALDGNIIGLGRRYQGKRKIEDRIQNESGLQVHIIGLGRKYYRPWTEILSALDGNIIGLDEAGTEPNSQTRNIIGLGRKYYRPWTEILSALDEAGTEMCWPWTELIPALDGINSVQGRWTTEGRRPSPPPVILSARRSDISPPRRRYDNFNRCAGPTFGVLVGATAPPLLRTASSVPHFNAPCWWESHPPPPPPFQLRAKARVQFWSWWHDNFGRGGTIILVVAARPPLLAELLSWASEAGLQPTYNFYFTVP